MSGNLTLTRSCQGLCHSAHSVPWGRFEMSLRVSTSAHLPSFRVPSSTESVEQIQCLPDSEQGRTCSVTQFIQADVPFVGHFYHMDIINSRVGGRWKVASSKEGFLKSLLLASRHVLVKFTELTGIVSIREQVPEGFPPNVC